MKPILYLLFSCLITHATTVHIVENGKINQEQTVIRGSSWKSQDGAVHGSGTGQTLGVKGTLSSENLTIKATLSIAETSSAASGIILGNEFFGFDSQQGTIFLEGGRFPFESIAETKGLLNPGKEFDLKIVSKDEKITFFIDGKQVAQKTYPATSLGQVALRPHRNILKIREFSITGEITPRSKLNHIFASGDDGYKSYRIPAMVTSTEGTLLAFCEGRVHGAGDHGDIDIVLKRSTDGGKTWSPLQVVHDFGKHVAGNPCPIVDRENNRIILLSCTSSDSEHALMQGQDRRGIFMQLSTDDGKTWNEPRAIDKEIYPENWRWYATGPCSGIQIREGKHAGRLVAPANHSVFADGNNTYRSHSIYSDDFGKTWQLGESAGPGSNESQIAETGPNELYQNMRMQSHRQGVRTIRRSSDGGATWTPLSHDSNLPGPACQGSVIRDYSQPHRLIFSNPASKNARHDMTIRISEDGGKTWPFAKLILPTSSAYSDLAITADQKIAILYEGGHDAYSIEGIIFETYQTKDIIQDPG